MKALVSTVIAASSLFASMARAETWGAIAYANGTGHWGYFFNAASQAEANAKAVDYCRQSGGTDCAESVWFTGCGSLARDPVSFKWGTAYGWSANEARSNAVLACNKVGGVDCHTQATICAADGLFPPTAPSPIYTNLNKGVIDYAVAHMGQQVGNGECWTLVNEALGSAGARRAGTGGLGTYEFGFEAFGVYAPGDILQFENVEFHYANGASYTYPHHTAIIESVSGTVLNLLQQNVNGDRTVQRGSIDLQARTQGTIRLFQPEP